ncbi:DNA integrity scanning diadenylate cyclase DisA [Azotosporobacter soli]|uniref:DNA integrity scanning diadenylate cyclase DisA n=1 Tax=Azotosporobacter soli TaxID=3055040 RepID=UPI0031FE8911
MNGKLQDGKLWDNRFIQTLLKLVPGTPLRDGLEHIIRAKMGALVFVISNAKMLELVDGGFEINCEYAPSAFYELAKMDGAIVLSGDAKMILCANAQLVPDSGIATSETGTRHRTAERVAKQTGGLVVAISQRRNVISLYMGNLRYTLRDISFILNRANQALQTLEKYRLVLKRALVKLSELEFEHRVTLADVTEIFIRMEQVHRIAREIELNIIELGTEGRLLSMQVEELLAEGDAMDLLLKDYCVSADALVQEQVREHIALLSEDNLEVYTICRLLGYGVTPNAVDIPVVPRGYRVLHQLPRLPVNVIDNLIAHFRVLPRICAATIEDLDEVGGVGEVRAKNIRDGLMRLKEHVRLDSYR